jgi:hypothetical protein
LALSKKARQQFDVEKALPSLDKTKHLLDKTPTKVLAFFTQRLLLSQASKVLYTPDDKTLSYPDITSATHNTVALDGSLSKTAESLLIAKQKLRLCRARNEVWSGAAQLEKTTSDTDNPTKTCVETMDLLKTFHEVTISQMIAHANTFWSHPNALSKSNDGMSQHYIRQCFGKLLLSSLTPDFKLLIQNKIPDTVILEGRLIWTTITHTIFLSKHVREQALKKQDSLKLNLTHLDNNYAKYIDRLRACLLLCPNDTNKQVHVTFLDKMQNHLFQLCHFPSARSPFLN